MADKIEDLALKSDQAANRLHHLSMAYVGSLIELVRGEKMAMIPAAYPGLRSCRDFLDLILLCRAEVNALVHILINNQVMSHETFLRVVAENYDHMAQVKCQQFGCTVTDYGLMFGGFGQPPTQEN
jgi:hypothetical protein